MSVKIENIKALFTSKKKQALSRGVSFLISSLTWRSPLFFNQKCELCENSRKQWGLCGYCLRGIEKECCVQSYQGMKIFSASEYGSSLRNLLHRIKYEGARNSLEELTDFLIDYKLPEEGVLVPIPLTLSRRRERGYNQAEVISRVLGKKWKVKVSPYLLHRTRFRGSQTQLSKGERIDNLQSTFKARSSSRNCQKIWLVDDIVTTGATLKSAERALTQRGYQVLGAITLARAISSNENRKGQLGLAIFGPDYGFFD